MNLDVLDPGGARIAFRDYGVTLHRGDLTRWSVARPPEGHPNPVMVEVCLFSRRDGRVSHHTFRADELAEAGCTIHGPWLRLRLHEKALRLYMSPADMALLLWVLGREDLIRGDADRGVPT